MAQLLLTRAKPNNAAFLKKLGRPDLAVFSKSLLLPKPIELSHQAKARLLDLDQFDKVIFISKNAVSYGLPLLEQYWPQWPVSLQWLAVGKGTADALSEFGVAAQFPQLASSEGLLALPVLERVAGQKVLIVRGVGGRETLKTGLSSRGATVEYLEVYERQTQQYAANAFPKGDDVVALLYSGEAIEHLLHLTGNQGRQYTLVVPSKRLAELANNIGFDKVELAKTQEDEAMIKALANTLRRLT